MRANRKVAKWFLTRAGAIDFETTFYFAVILGAAVAMGIILLWWE